LKLKKFKFGYPFFFICIFTFFVFLLLLANLTSTIFSQKTNSSTTKIEDYDLHVYKKIESKVQGFDRVEMLDIEKKFLNGVIRKYKPKKILEIGVSKGGSSAIILNAIEDMEDAKLYSVDISENCYRIPSKKVGFLVEEDFRHLQNKWELHTGGICANFIEKIGKDIDLCFIDTVHVTPGEMLDILVVLPFLKENAVIVLHDIGLHFPNARYKGNYYCDKHSNNQIFAYLKGKKFMPETKETGNDMFKDIFFNIGAVELDSNQKDSYFDYFFPLSFHWEYMPDITQLEVTKGLLKKHYEDKYIKMFEAAIEANRLLKMPVPTKKVKK
jgi:predicted O-methyltransferase YrrM